MQKMQYLPTEEKQPFKLSFIMAKISLFVISIFVIFTLSYFHLFHFKDSNIKASFYQEIAANFENKDNIKSLQNYKKSGDIYKNLGDFDKASNAYLKNAFYHIKLGNLYKAEKVILEALDINNANYKDEDKTQIYLLLAQISTPQNSLDYTKLSQNLAKNTANNIANIKALMLEAKAYQNLAKFEEAEKTYKRAIFFANKEKELKNSSYQANLLGQIGAYYLEYGDKKKAINYFEEAAKISKNIEDNSLEAEYLKALAYLKDNKGNYNNAALDRFNNVF